jgi:hypothetical protein
MALQKLIGGPAWDVVSNPDYALFADFHYFISSGSTERSNPWNSPTTPIAKVLNVSNITANSVVANYVSSSGLLTNVILSSGSTAQIESQTIPLGLDNTAWISASIVSDFTGSVTARTTGSRWFELESIRTISQDTYIYTIADGATTITRTNTGQPVSGSLRYRCSRTIPYVDNGWWIIRDLYDCTGGTTTTTTAAPTTTTTSTTTTTTAAPTTTTTSTTTTSTTTTTTLASQKYYVESCAQEDGGPVLSGIIQITNAPLLTSKIIRVNTPVASVYSCFQVFSTSTGTISLGTRSVTNIYTDCVDCTD